MLKVIALFIFLLCGCVSVPHKETGINIHCWSNDLKVFVPMQQQEIAKRFKNANAIFCHGNTKNGTWYLFPDEEFGKSKPVSWTAREFVKKHPTVPLVLLVCNPGKHSLNIRGVYYFKGDVWGMPDSQAKGIMWDVNTRKFVNNNHEVLGFHDAAGSIWEAFPLTK